MPLTQNVITVKKVSRRVWLSSMWVWLVAIAMQASPVMAQHEQIQILDDVIVVTATRVPTTFSELSRTVFIIGMEEIASSPGRSIGDLLSRVPGVDVRRQGSHGVQADVSIRGGTFQQTLFLIDGIKVSDPQTGHHNLDLPVTMADVGRIEILKGPGSRLYGPNAMSGVVNVITKQATGRRVQLETSGGSDGFFDRQLAVTYPIAGATHRLALSRRSSSGYRDNTEFDIRTMAYRTGFTAGENAVRLLAGYAEKEFGAYKFYSDRFPDEWEATKTWFLSVDADLKTAPVSLTPRFFWRRHEDDFVLDRNRPDWFRNNHSTDHYGAEIQTSLATSWGTTVIGGELASEEIESSNLGDHSRNRGGLFFEQRFKPTPRLSLVPGAWIFRYSDWGWEAWPGIDIGYRLTSTARIYFSTGRSYRIPTYTELFYKSPANMGNPELRPEEAWTHELGAALSGDMFSANLSLFVRKGSNLIDWGRGSPDDPWQVLNVSETTTQGIEVGLGIDPAPVWTWFSTTHVAVRYAYLDSDRKTGTYESKYMLDHLKHEAIFDIDQLWFSMMKQSWRLRYLDRYNGDNYIVVDSRVTGNYNSLGLFVEVVNLFNASYVEVGTIPMPGRWFRIGVRINIADD